MRSERSLAAAVAVERGAAAPLSTQLGLQILSEGEAAIVFRCGGGTQLDVTRRRPMEVRAPGVGA